MLLFLIAQIILLPSNQLIKKAALESNGTIDQSQAFAFVSTNLERALGLTRRFKIPDLVMYRGDGVFDIESKAVGVVSSARKVVVLF